MTAGARQPMRPRLLPTVGAVIAALVLVVAGLAVAAYNENTFKAQASREAQVQADIVAASVTAALAFDDESAAQEYLDALRANPQVEAAGLYNSAGRLLAGYRREARQALPTRVVNPFSAQSDGHIMVAAPVVQGATRLGSVYIRTDAEPPARRAFRYVAIGLLGVMASLVVVILAGANSVQRQANRALGEANEMLRLQIEQRERAEEALRQSQKMEAMGQLTGGVAHDFNNLLMVASSGLELLDRTQDPRRRETLRQAVRQALDRGADLTRQLLAFSRRSPLKSSVVDLGAQLDGMRVLLDRSLREDIVVRFDIEPGLWPVEVDPVQLEVALLNIAVNARDAMPNGGLITIRARNRPDRAVEGLDGDFVELTVTDTGRGMSAETIHRVFEPFFTTKAVGKGTGLGLSQVYGFTRASGGDARIRSEPGRGAAISLFFPRSTRPLDAPAADAGPPPEVRTPANVTVLLVEDDDAVAHAVGAMLSELGYRYDRAPNATAALERLESGQHVDLVFSDMVMPGAIDGVTLARVIRDRWPDLPVVLTSGFSEAADAAARDGWRLLAKPYRMETLAAELAAARADGPAPRDAAAKS
ncbi:MAG: integral rane sensor hybrid histidine kinase [Caulobacteraceae bacterium]|nr:integral rane sensor hybrid histidine kinase [Caulobacteraceae bacterium]